MTIVEVVVVAAVVPAVISGKGEKAARRVRLEFSCFLYSRRHIAISLSLVLMHEA
jgi:hypothetical protein